MLTIALALADPCVPARFVREQGVLTAIQVAVQLDIASTDEVLWAQLDTGVGPALRLQGRALTGRITPQRNVPSSAKGFAELAIGGSIGDHTFPAQPVVVAMKEGKPGGSIGSVGARAFHGRVLELDLQQDRVCVHDGVPEVHADACFAPLHLDREGRPLVQVGSLGAFLFDTGSAPQGLWVDAAAFQELTGKKHDAPEIARRTGSAFGKPLVIHQAPALTSHAVGAIPLDHPLVTHIPGREHGVDRVGVLGLQPLDGSIVLLDLRRGRLGRVGGTCASTDRDAVR